MFKRNTVFRLEPVFEVEGVTVACYAELAECELFSFIVRSGDLMVSKLVAGSRPVVRWIPWFDDIKRKIKAMAFTADGRFLMVVCADATVYMVPGLGLLEACLPDQDQPWSHTDITLVAAPAPQDLNPSCAACWTRTPSEPDLIHIGILGYSNGNVVIFSLATGSVIINIKIDGPVSSIDLFYQRPNASVLLTNDEGSQWRLQLTEVQPTQIEVPKAECSKSSSRLQGLKQLSVDTIASIKQRITEGRSRSVPVLQPVECCEGETVSCAPHWQLNVTCEKVVNNLVRYTNKTVSVSYPAGVIAVDNFERHTDSVHKLPLPVRHLVVTDCLFVFTDDSKNKLYVASQELSVCKSDPNKEILSDASSDSLLEEFQLDSDESVISVYCMKSSENRCIIVSNLRIYCLSLKDSPRNLVLENIMSLDNLDCADKLSSVFRLDLQELICEAANLHIKNGRNSEASQLYSLSKGGSLRNAVMLAVQGQIPEILTALNNQTNNNKIHFANLKILAFVHQYLTNYSEELHKNLLEMLKKGGYDEALAVSVLAQAGLCEDLLTMTRQRGLQPVTVVALANILQHNYPLNVIHCSGFWNLITDYSLCEALLARPKVAKIHLTFIQCRLGTLDPDKLLSLESLYNPFRPPLYPWISATCQGDVPICLWVQTYLMICIHLSSLEDFSLDYLMRRSFCLDFLPATGSNVYKRSVGTGFNHCAVIINGNCYSWGCSLVGCLGTGPTVIRAVPPAIIDTFPNVGLRVISVVSGRNHTLAITDNGVYAWGNNRYGQLGFCGASLSWFPTYVEYFSHKDIVQVSAGQYHSLALDSSGTVYSWGWGVHGQLGHGNVESFHEPKVVEELVDRGIVLIAGGHAHSLFLDSSGRVWACGSSAFGQLGTGSNTKTSVPCQVFGLPEPIRDLATGYFHSVAVAEGGRVYQWGCSPTVLRATAHAAKRKMRGQETTEAPMEDGMSYLSPTLVDTSHVKDTIRRVSVGVEHSVLLTEDGTVYTWGRNMDGQLGIATTQKKPQTIQYPTPITIGANIREVGCGGDYTVALDSTGKVWTWGANHHSPSNLSALAALDGEVVVFKMKSRVIKLPHGATATNNPLPTLLHVPTQYSELKKKAVSRLREALPTWKERMHFAIETLDCFYQARPLLELASSVKECEAGAKIALVENDLTTGLNLLLQSANVSNIPTILNYYLPLAFKLNKPLSPTIECILSAWLSRCIPVPPLEAIFEKYFAETATTLGFLLFRVNTDYSPFVSRFSTEFNLRVLDTLINNGEENLECILPGVESIKDAIVAINLSDSYIDINESTVYESVSCTPTKYPDSQCPSSISNRKPALYLK